MLSRALILAAVALLLGGLAAAPAEAQNLEAGKPPSAIFSSTCSLCHKSSRGLLKSVAPGSLPGFLRQHYTTSTDMAAAMSAYVLSNGAANAALPGGNLTKQGEESKSAPKPSPDKPEQAAKDGAKDSAKDGAKGRKPVREASRPDIDGLEDIPGQEAPAADGAKSDAARGAKQKGAKGKPPKVEASREPPKEEPQKSESSRTDPVPAVTPAPKGTETASDAAAKPPADDPNRPLTIDIGQPLAPQASAVAPAGPPAVPISQ